MARGGRRHIAAIFAAMRRFDAAALCAEPHASLSHSLRRHTAARRSLLKSLELSIARIFGHFEPHYNAPAMLIIFAGRMPDAPSSTNGKNAKYPSPTPLRHYAPSCRQPNLSLGHAAHRKASLRYARQPRRQSAGHPYCAGQLSGNRCAIYSTGEIVVFSSLGRQACKKKSRRLGREEPKPGATAAPFGPMTSKPTSWHGIQAAA